MKTRHLIVALVLCAALCKAGDATDSTGLIGFVTATPETVGLNGILCASVVVSNASPETIVIDTTPDEIIQAKSKDFGEVTRPRGSSLTITVYQDLDGDGRGIDFRTGKKKMGSGSSEVNVALNPGGTHLEQFSFNFSLPYLASNPMREGPAKVKATLHLVIDGKELDLACRECHVVMKKDNERITTKSTSGSGVAPGAHSGER